MFETRDSGKREEYASGMVRDTEEGKARFDLILPLGVPYQEQMLTRFAALMGRGADKYGDRNWEKAEGEEELRRYYSSALRHLQQWVAGESDEDHAAAVMFNVMAGEHVKFRMRQMGVVTDEFARGYGEGISNGLAAAAAFDEEGEFIPLGEQAVADDHSDCPEYEVAWDDYAPLGIAESEGPDGEKPQCDVINCWCKE